jgi:small-conductance mechanosensitive channel
MNQWPWQKLFFPLSIAVGCSLILLIVRKLLLGSFSRWLQRRFPKLGDHMIVVFRGPSIILCVAAGVYLGIAVSELSSKYTQGLLEATHALVVLSITLAVANLAVSLFKNIMAGAHGERQASGLLVNLIHASIMAVGCLVVLSILGISIAPLLTALGVGGLAVALALKDTLENLFAGIYLLTDRALMVGDYVKLDTGSEGFVEDIGWRTTRIRMSDLNMLIVPNSKLSQSNVINFCLPNRNLQASLSLSVSYDADPQQVEDELIKLVIQGSEDIGGLLATPPPVVRFAPGFNSDSLDFILYFNVKEFSDQAFVRHELKKRVVSKFKKLGIPFPEKRIVVSQGPVTTV